MTFIKVIPKNFKNVAYLLSYLEFLMNSFTVLSYRNKVHTGRQLIDIELSFHHYSRFNRHTTFGDQGYGDYVVQIDFSIAGFNRSMIPGDLHDSTDAIIKR